MISIRFAAFALLVTASAAQAQPGPVKAESAWARATPPRTEIGAVYVTLTASAADRLVGVSTPVAAKAEVHEMSMEGGVMRMRETPGVMLPAGQPIVLGPGGFHIMLVGLKAPLQEGQSIPLHLVFASAPAVDVVAKVQGVGARAPAR